MGASSLAVGGLQSAGGVSYGGQAVTPNLDRLASHGARFSFAHSHAVVTLTSHASMLTGRYPYEHGIRDNTGYRLAPNTPTAATRLKPDNADAYSNTNANTGCESDTGTYRFADVINTGRSTAWKAQDKGRADPCHQRCQRCQGAINPRICHSYADEGAVRRTSGAISWRLLLPCYEIASSSS
jgi:hypothetical protein